MFDDDDDDITTCVLLAKIEIVSIGVWFDAKIPSQKHDVQFEQVSQTDSLHPAYTETAT